MTEAALESEVSKKLSSQFSTFTIGDCVYGIEVMRVQEITKPMSMTEVPLAPRYVRGLINLRGQIATAICLRSLFQIQGEVPSEQMNVICRVDSLLLSFLVDRIGDVVEVAQNIFESPPDTVPESVRRYMEGVYKVSNSLLSIINVDKIASSFGSSETAPGDEAGKA